MNKLPRLPEIPQLPEISELDEAVRDINSMTNKLPSRAPREVHKFVNIAEQLAESMLEASQQQLNVAQNQLEETKQYVESLRLEIKKRSEALSDLTERVQEFGKTMLSAHKRFHDGGDQ